MKACNQCGKCCLAYSDGGLCASSEEIRWWEVTRPDIARYVRNGEIWMDPDTGLRLSRCPWLQAEQTAAGGRTIYQCAIYHDRPDDCRHYPVDIAQMRADGCDMLELKDLSNPRAAQRQLDTLMADSRPPLTPSSG